jgi:hypothetical protein
VPLWIGIDLQIPVGCIDIHTGRGSEFGVQGSGFRVQAGVRNTEQK